MLAHSTLHQPSSLPATAAGRRKLMSSVLWVRMDATEHVLGKHQLLGFAPRTCIIRTYIGSFKGYRMSRGNSLHSSWSS